ncbi:hypothetical protein WMY93_034382, partial [Mugilogobius chulae]
SERFASSKYSKSPIASLPDTTLSTLLWECCSLRDSSASPRRLQKANVEWDNRPPPPPAVSYQPTSHHFSQEIRAIQAENAKLHQSQQWIQSGIKELYAVQSEMKELIEAARSLKTDISYSTGSPVKSSYMPGAVAPLLPKVEPEEDWPDPPPWPEPEEDQKTHVQQLQFQRDSNQLHSLTFPEHDLAWPPPPPPHSFPASGYVNYSPLAPPPTQHRSPPERAPPVSQRPSYSAPLPAVEPFYRGPQPTIPKFINPDPSEFARLRIALENLLPANATELFSYQILVDHLILEEARLIADAYLNSPTPYSDTMAALHDKFGQPHQLALRKIASVLEAPEVRRGDVAAFQKFSLQVQSLVGLLQTLGPEGEVELNCGSHVARLLSKLPVEQRADFRRHTFKQTRGSCTLLDLSEWLRYESWCQGFDPQPTPQVASNPNKVRPPLKYDSRGKPGVSVFHSADESVLPPKVSPEIVKTYCAYCENTDHHLGQCSEVAKLSKEQLKEWIQVNRRCWRCARAHLAAQCTLKKPCSKCNGKHLLVLHEVNVRNEKVSVDAVEPESCLTVSASAFLNQLGTGTRTLLKIVPVLLHYDGRSINAFALLDDGSQRSMLLPAAAKALGIRGTAESLPLRTVRQDIQVITGHSVSFCISPASKPHISFKIKGAFTSDRLSLARHSYPIEQLQQKFLHLRDLPLPVVCNAEPLLLIGSDQPHLVTPVEPVRLGPALSPVAVHTRLGWTLQGPVHLTGRPSKQVQCLFISSLPQSEPLNKHEERIMEIVSLSDKPEMQVSPKEDPPPVATSDLCQTDQSVLVASRDSDTNPEEADGKKKETFAELEKVKEVESDIPTLSNQKEDLFTRRTPDEHLFNPAAEKQPGSTPTRLMRPHRLWQLDSPATVSSLSSCPLSFLSLCSYRCSSRWCISSCSPDHQ